MAPGGGWCVFLGKPAGSPLTRDDAGKIALKVFGAIDAGQGVYGILPPGLNLYGQMADGAKRAIAARLAEWLADGTPCDQIPPNLADDPEIHKTIPTTPGDVLGNVFNVILDWTGLGQIVIRGAVLVGIVVLALIAIRRLV